MRYWQIILTNIDHWEKKNNWKLFSEKLNINSSDKQKFEESVGQLFDSLFETQTMFDGLKEVHKDI